MTPAELREAGHFLYGDHWRPRLAEVLGCNRSTVQRWAAGAVVIGGPAAYAIRCLVESKRIRQQMLEPTFEELL